MKRTLPLLITALSGFILIAAFFVPFAQSWGEQAAIWFDILASIAFVLGGGNLITQHLKKISDGQKGWGYSAIIASSFLVTLFIGMIKWGAQPAGNTEFFGEVFVTCPVDLLPETTIPGDVPPRGDGTDLPLSVRRQLIRGNGQLAFRGWMTRSQLHDLIEYQDDLAWRALVEELHAQAQPPDVFKGRLQYRSDQGALSINGPLTEAEENQLLELLGDDLQKQVKELAKRSRETVSVEVTRVPPGFSIPEELHDVVTLQGSTLSIRGPMSIPLRDEIATEWVNPRRLRSLSHAERQALRQQIELAGQPLTADQAKVFEDEMRLLETSAEILILAINSAGTGEAESKTWRELYAEFQAGQRFLEEKKPAPESLVLNSQQEELVRQFAADGSMTAEQLSTQLAAAGPFNGAMRNAVEKSIQTTPTEADVWRELCLKLLEVGPLTVAQRELLVRPYREEYQWRQAVGRLCLLAHQTKYHWSGAYNEHGTPFWWLYEYVFQPLLTTTFAVLAFYVASAAFRAFRAKNLEATLLLGTAFLILLRSTFLGGWYSSLVPEALSMDNLTAFIMGTMNTAGNRAIMLGIALGIASTSLKVLLGIDRSYLGSSDE